MRAAASVLMPAVVRLGGWAVAGRTPPCAQRRALLAAPVAHTSTLSGARRPPAAAQTAPDTAPSDTVAGAATPKRRSRVAKADPTAAPAATNGSTNSSGSSAAAAAAAAADSSALAPPGGPHPSKVVFLGIDPDSSGAVAVLSWGPESLLPLRLPPPAAAPKRRRAAGAVEGAGASKGRGQLRREQEEAAAAEEAAAGAASDTGDAVGETVWGLDGAAARVQVFDMPIVTTALPPKRKDGPARSKKRLDVDAVATLAWQLVSEHAPGHVRPHGSSSSSNGSSSNGSSGSGGPVVLRAFLEVAPIRPMNGTFAIHNLGFSVGVFQGALRAAGFDVCTVEVKAWKRDLGLMKAEKDDSRTLAAGVFPQRAELISRAKDHGRAEALLIAAWGAGLVIDPSSGAPSWGPPRHVRMDGGGNRVASSNIVNSDSGGLAEAQGPTRRAPAVAAARRKKAAAEEVGGGEAPEGEGEAAAAGVGRRRSAKGASPSARKKAAAAAGDPTAE